MLQSLEEAVIAAGLVDTLRGVGPFTVLAPTKDAFATLAVTAPKYLNDPGYIAYVRNALFFHVAVGVKVLAGGPIYRQVIEMANEESVMVEKSDAGVFFTPTLGQESPIFYGGRSSLQLRHAHHRRHKLTPLFLGTDLATLAGNAELDALVAAVTAAGLAEIAAFRRKLWSVHFQFVFD